MNNPWISFWGNIIAALVVAIGASWSVHIFNLEQEAKRKHEILQERKVALFDALHVIDLVYANSNWNGSLPLNPTEWDINLARNATNKMLIYCKDPKNTVNAFYNAVGLYNPSIESAPGISPKYLDDFRKQVALELGLQEFKATDPKRTWIASLTGTKEAKEYKKRRTGDSVH